MFAPLKLLLRRVVQTGDLVAVDSHGVAHRFGDGTGDAVRIRFADARLERGLVINPDLAAGEGYMQGRLLMEEGRIYDFIALMMRNMEMHPLPHWSKPATAVRRVTRAAWQYNPVWRSRRNVQHHYDISPAIYDLFLDPDRQYSCGYFEQGADLDRAQLLKKRHIAAKLALEPKQSVLDIGSGWGGLAAYLSQNYDVRVTGLTLSTEQHRYSCERVAKLSLADRVGFKLLDYREEEQTYDRVVSVGMFEHVGRPQYTTFFAKVRALLADNGVALIHTIGRADTPSTTNGFIAKYIFPGGYIPALSEIMPAIERAGLFVTDIEVLRLHYAETLKAWRARFCSNWARAVEISGEEFCRMWEFYLAASEAAFRHQGLVVFQIQLARHVDTLPITRGYMLDEERRLARKEGELKEPPRLAGE